MKEIAIVDRYITDTLLIVDLSTEFTNTCIGDTLHVGGFRKYPYYPHRREMEIPGGWGVLKDPKL